MASPDSDSWNNLPDKNNLAREFNDCEFARLLGLEVVEIRPGGARIRMASLGKCNSNGVLHGGAIFSLADHAFGLAANTDGFREVAVSAHIHYMTPGTGPLEAVAERIFRNGQTSVYRVLITEGSRTIALFEGVGIRV
ncbi:MAG: hotdog fold thioesterase [Methanoregulaceae archaeon]